jgi:hypothetical protein
MKTVRHDWMTTARIRAKRAIEAGEKEEALKAVDEVWAEGRPIHDLYGDMAAVFLDFITEKLGEEAVEEAWRYVGEKLWRPVLEAYQGDPERLAATYAMFLRSHGYDFTCEEDDEKICFFLHYCPSGGRMLQEGKAETSARHPLNLGVTKKAHSWGFNQRGVLYYCAHTQLWFDTQPKEWGMNLFAAQYGEFNEKGEVVGRPCAVTIYKRPRTIASPVPSSLVGEG